MLDQDHCLVRNLDELSQGSERRGQRGDGFLAGKGSSNRSEDRAFIVVLPDEQSKPCVSIRPFADEGRARISTRPSVAKPDRHLRVRAVDALDRIASERADHVGPQVMPEDEIRDALKLDFHEPGFLNRRM
jgi:hypothetical protein